MADDHEEEPVSPDVHFEPIVRLPLMETKTLEEDEEEIIKLRAKLFRYDTTETPAEWKERGTGEVKILRHKDKKTYRIVMRRDKTLKICANHYIKTDMELKPNSTSDRAWVWNTPADFADEHPKPELFAIRFANCENAQKFKAAFDEAKKSIYSSGDVSPENSPKKNDEISPKKQTENEKNQGDNANDLETTKEAKEMTERLKSENAADSDDSKTLAEAKEIIEKLKDLTVGENSAATE